MAGCGSSRAAGGHDSAGYRVLTGRVTVPAGSGAVSGSTGLPTITNPAAHFWAMSSVATTFSDRSTVELLATGRPDVRFELFWEEACGGNGAGKRAVVGGTGGEAQLTLITPALVLVKLPLATGTYHGCYLAATVSMHGKTFLEAKREAPQVKILHY